MWTHAENISLKKKTVLEEGRRPIFKNLVNKGTSGGQCPQTHLSPSFPTHLLAVGVYSGASVPSEFSSLTFFSFSFYQPTPTKHPFPQAVA